MWYVTSGDDAAGVSGQGGDHRGFAADQRPRRGVRLQPLGRLVAAGAAVALAASSATVVMPLPALAGTSTIPNGAPEVTVPAAPLMASAGTENDYPPSTSDPALFSVADPELCLRAPNNRCGGAYDQAPAPLLPELDDAMLLVMWLAEPGCGQFHLRSTGA